MTKQGEIRIGISGWRYAPWREVFYPKGLRQKDELAFAARKFRTLEINGTFYGTQRPESFESWRDTVPEDFVFAVKAPRFITHIRRLRDVEVPLANFLASGVLRLGPKLGPILWQFPPNMAFDAALFQTFLELLPHHTHDAAEIAKRHDARLKHPDQAKIMQHHVLRHAVEIRHESFRVAAFIELLRRTNVALVCADTVKWPRMMDITSDFIYCRLHGSEELYASGYDDEALTDWSKRAKAWATGKEPQDAALVPDAPRGKPSARDVFIYFDNDMKVRAPVDAARLEEFVGIRPRTDTSKNEKSKHDAAF
jgi:uncharacterized protein YecE (DUF72 family)